MTDDYDQFTKRMTSFDMVLGDDDPMAHSDDPSDIFLAHYGVKGMKWGVRRSDEQLARSAERKEARAAKKEAKVEARKTARKEAWSRPTTEDARTANAARSRSEKHGTDALDTKELQALVTRMNLEQQYANLQASGKAKTARQAGQEYISDILKDTGRQLIGDAVKWAAQEAVKSAFNSARGGGPGGPTSATATRVGQLALETGARKLRR